MKSGWFENETIIIIISLLLKLISINSIDRVDPSMFTTFRLRINIIYSLENE